MAVDVPDTNALQELDRVWPRVAVRFKARLKVDAESAPDVVKDKLSLDLVEVTLVLPDLAQAVCHGREAGVVVSQGGSLAEQSITALRIQNHWYHLPQGSRDERNRSSRSL